MHLASCQPVQSQEKALKPRKKETMAKNTQKNTVAKVPDEPKRIGRPPNQPRTVEERLMRLEGKLYKINARVNSIEEAILKLEEVQANWQTEFEKAAAEITVAKAAKPTSTVEPEYDERLEQMNENIVQIKEMLFQLCDSLGEENDE
jgi:chromosome segregation ATPase